MYRMLGWNASTEMHDGSIVFLQRHRKKMTSKQTTKLKTREVCCCFLFVPTSTRVHTHGHVESFFFFPFSMLPVPVLEYGFIAFLQ